jgi:hypothetical protein
MFKHIVDNILPKTSTLRINLNIDGSPILSHTHSLTPPTHQHLVSQYSLSLGIHSPVYT